jgi:alkaline phosphatase D
MRRAALIVTWMVVVVSGLGSPASAQFASGFDRAPDRPWPGPEYWANPLQDWRISGGALECTKTGPARSLILLTRELSDRTAPFSTSIAIAPWRPQADKASSAWLGFRIAARGRFGDYRDDAVYGKGIEAGMRADGSLFIGESSHAAVGDVSTISELRIELTTESDGWQLRLGALDSKGIERAATYQRGPDPRDLRGAIGIVCSEAPCRIAAWQAAGPKLDAHDERAFGPILFTQYTLSRNVLKLTAQMAPVGPSEPQEVKLSVRAPGSAGAWRDVGRATIDPLARTATFRVTNWDDAGDHGYRVSYESRDTRGQAVAAAFDGTIRRDPRSKARSVVAAFTGNNDLGFPHADVVAHVAAFEPDLLVFTGDQIYEPVGGFGVQRAPLEMAALDYLRKWFMYGWEYRELLRNVPSVALPDDHDVYHGNIWGAGGRDANEIVPALRREGVGVQTQKQDSGGYTMPAAWVNMVQRTQTSHLPDPVDPAPVAQGIGVYFTELVWGGVSYAIIEDRKWKSAPAVMLPEAQVVNGWARNPEWDSSENGDVKGAELLGPRQMRFLERWAGDSSMDVWMKALVSQTVFANVATLPRGSRADDITTKLPIQPPGGYAPGEAPVQDHDSNGWPQSPRLAALRLMKKAGAVHISGDQHLGMTIQYGIDAFRDGPFAICVPSVANFWPRRWFPEADGASREPGAPRNTGDYLDGFGNKMTVLAVSNPFKLGIEPADINDRAPGYGIITFDRLERTITLANWPRWVDPKAPGAKPYPGWPITIRQQTPE